MLNRPCAFDAAGGGGFLGDVHADEEIHIGDELREGVQLAQKAGGFLQQSQSLGSREHPFVIDGSRQKAAVLVLLLKMSGLKCLISILFQYLRLI